MPLNSPQVDVQLWEKILGMRRLHSAAHHRSWQYMICISLILFTNSPSHHILSSTQLGLKIQPPSLYLGSADPDMKAFLVFL